MLLPTQIAWINSPYNVHLLLTYTVRLSQCERYIEISNLYTPSVCKRDLFSVFFPSRHGLTKEAAFILFPETF